MARTDSRPRRTSVYNLPTAFELYSQSYKLIRKNLNTFAWLFAVSGLMALWDTLGSYVKDEDSRRGWKDYLTNGVFGPDTSTAFAAGAGGIFFVLGVLSVIAYLMVIILSLRTAQGHRPSLGQVWKEFKADWLWLKLIGAMVAAAVLVVLGLILLIVPGVILLWRLFLTPYALIDEKKSIGDALRRSWEMTRGYPGAIYGIIGVSILLSFSGIVPIIGPIVAFLLTSAYTVAPALRYEQLKKLA